MGRNYKENPEIIFSIPKKIEKFIDCLNEAKIFQEKISYTDIDKKGKKDGNKLELKLTFRENIEEICKKSNSEETNEQFSNYIIEQLNNIPNMEFKQINNVFIELKDKTNEEHYKIYTIANTFEVFNQIHEENEEISNNCILIIRTYNKTIPLFEIFGL